MPIASICREKPSAGPQFHFPNKFFTQELHLENSSIPFQHRNEPKYSLQVLLQEENTTIILLLGCSFYTSFGRQVCLQALLYRKRHAFQAFIRLVHFDMHMATQRPERFTKYATALKDRRLLSLTFTIQHLTLSIITIVLCK